MINMKRAYAGYLLIILLTGQLFTTGCSNTEMDRRGPHVKSGDTHGQSETGRQEAATDRLSKQIDGLKVSLDQNKELMAAVSEAKQLLRKAETARVKSEAYADLARNLVGKIANYNHAEKTLDRILKDLDTNINPGDKGLMVIKDHFINCMDSIDFVFFETEKTMRDMGSGLEDHTELRKLARENQAFYMDVIRRMKKDKMFLQLLKDETGDKESGINDIRELVRYAREVLIFARQVHTHDLEIAAAVWGVNDL